MRFAARTLGALALTLALVGCAHRPQAPTVRGHAEHGPAALFDRSWVWNDEAGERVTLDRWRGSLVVLTTIYTTCVRTCPRTVDDLQKLSEAFRRDGRDAQFLLVTLDPTVDTPARLREYKESRGLPASWHLLSGSVRQTRELTDLIDVHVMDADSHVFHEAKISIFDPRGALTWSFAFGDLDGASPVLLPNL